MMVSLETFLQFTRCVPTQILDSKNILLYYSIWSPHYVESYATSSMASKLSLNKISSAPWSIFLELLFWGSHSSHPKNTRDQYVLVYFTVSSFRQSHNQSWLQHSRYGGVEVRCMPNHDSMVCPSFCKLLYSKWIVWFQSHDRSGHHHIIL